MAQMSQAGDLTSGPMLKKIILFSLPLAASSFLQLLFNAADVVVVGRFAGSAALAAVGSNGALINLLVNLFVGLALGANVVAARCYGAKDDQGVHEAVQTAVTLSLVGGVLMAFVGFFAAHGPADGSELLHACRVSALEKTKLGYELRATGCNKFAAKYCGMKEKRNIILTMAIAGGLAGMGAATLFLTGFEQWQVTQSAVPAMGFNGIAAAFLGGLNPIGAIFSSYFIQHITNGGAYVDKTMYSAQISDLISALIIYLCGFVLFFKVFMNSRLDRRDEKRRAKEDRPGSEEGGKA